MRRHAIFGDGDAFKRNEGGARKGGPLSSPKIPSSLDRLYGYLFCLTLASFLYQSTSLFQASSALPKRHRLPIVDGWKFISE